MSTLATYSSVPTMHGLQVKTNALFEDVTFDSLTFIQFALKKIEENLCVVYCILFFMLSAL